MTKGTNHVNGEGRTVSIDGFVTIASSDQGAPFVESYGRLLATILLGSDGQAPRVVAVTAAQTGDGVSTTALNLAMTMARTGRPAAVVDANLRAPVLHKAFGLALAPGLAEVLMGRAELKAATVPTRVPNVSLLPAGGAGTPAQALLSQPGLKEVFDLLRARFDLVVVDTPPILQYPDTLHIAKCVDAVLQVVSSQGASRRDQQETRALLDRVGAPVLGTVLNRVYGPAKPARVPVR
jgi:capsular exopolysaccharide synthesis family protein